MQPGNVEAGGHTTITVRSTSACCRGEIRTISIDDHHLSEFKEILDGFMLKLSNEHHEQQRLSMV
jgi:hypothetical protein